MEAFVQVPKHILFDPNLSNNAKVAYSALLDRMSLSRQRKQYYSDKQHNFFVLFSQKQMADVLGLCERTVNTIYKELESHNLIKREAQFNASDRIFLPTAAKITGTEPQKLQPSNTKANNINKTTINTVNTGQLDKPNKLELWTQAVTGKIGLTGQTTKLILEQTHNDLDLAYQFVKVITNARNSVVKEHHLKRSNQTDFKTNSALVRGLSGKLRSLFCYLPNKLEEQLRYMTTALKNYFTECLGLGEDKYMPKNSNRLEDNFNRKLPKWMTEKYDPSKDKLDPAEKAALDRKMAKLKEMDRQAQHDRYRKLGIQM